LAAVAALAGAAVDLTGLRSTVTSALIAIGLPLGLVGVGGLLGTLLRDGLLAALLGDLLPLGLLLATLLRDLLLLGLLLAALLRRLLLSGVLLGPPLRSLVGVARGAVTGERGAQLAQVGDDGLSLVLLLTELVEQDIGPQVGKCARLARLEAQLLLGQLHDLRVSNGDAVSLADLRDEGGLDEGAGDVHPRRGLALLLRLLAGLGLQLLGHHVDVLLGHDDGVAPPPRLACIRRFWKRGITFVTTISRYEVA